MFSISGQFFRLISNVSPVDVEFYLRGQKIGEALQMDSGFYSDGMSFDRVDVTTGALEVVKFGVTDRRMGYDRSAGSVVITGGTVSVAGITNQAAPGNTQKTVTNASAQLLAVNAARRFLMVQNKDSSGRIWLYFGAAAATQSNGLMLEPGEELVLNDCVPTVEIRAIGDAASNANVVVIEG